MVGARQFDDDEVIAIALDVFWRKGLHEATMQDIAAATGVQRGSLYNAYGDKESIFLRAYDQYSEQFLGSAANTFVGENAAREVETFLNLTIVHMTRGTPQRGCLTTRTALVANEQDIKVRERVQDLLGRLEQIISRAIVSASGLPAADANRLARVVVTFTRGLAVLERAGYTRKQLKESAATFVEAMFRRA